MTVMKLPAAEGPDAFYAGENARLLSAAVTNAPKNPVPMTPADLAAYKALPRDPVCGMTVAVDPANHPVEHDGRTYYFCCPGCRYSFKKDPASFLSQEVSC